MYRTVVRQAPYSGRPQITSAMVTSVPGPSMGIVRTECTPPKGGLKVKSDPDRNATVLNSGLRTENIDSI